MKKMKKMKISRDAWRDEYLPEYDENEPGFLKMYQTDDLITTKRDVDAHYIWTELDNLEGTVIPGARFVNRVCYYITEKPWRDEDYHSLEVTEFTSKDDYLQRIIEVEEDDPDCAEELQERMEEEFNDD